MTANDHHMPDSMYVVSVHGDGAGAYLVQGWAALCASVITEHYGEPDEAQRREVLRLLDDEGMWALGFDGLPFHWFIRLEEGSIEVRRITHNRPAACR